MRKLKKLKKRATKFFDKHEMWPILTLTLAAILVVAFILQQILPWEDLGFIPAHALSRPWTFITSVFLHSGVKHLVYNLIGLLFFGCLIEIGLVEIQISRKTLLAVFLLAGVAGSFGQMITRPAWVGGIGASGAIYGILGFLGATCPTMRFGTFPIWVWAFMYGFGGFVGIFYPYGGIGHGAHFAGLITGIIFGIYWRISKSRRIKAKKINS